MATLLPREDHPPTSWVPTEPSLSLPEVCARYGDREDLDDTEDGWARYAAAAIGRYGKVRRRRVARRSTSVRT